MRIFQSWLALGAAMATMTSLASAKKGPTSVAYVEVNHDSIANVGHYALPDGSNAFDLAIIFAANINYNGTAAVLYNNPQVQATLDNSTAQIRPLQAKGIKVLLSVLGNHQGAGISNFASPAAAAAFAAQVRDVVQAYGLDGVDLDDEYADYGANGTPQPNNQSIGWLISALRSALGAGKLITFYYYGPASTSLASTSSTVASQLNYAWNGVYGSYRVPTVPGLGKAKLAPAAVDIQTTSQTTASLLARRTVSEGYGVFMSYDLRGGDESAYVSTITQALYGQKATYK